MLNRFQQSTIEDFITLEEITNTSICVIDRKTNQIRKANCIDEYVTNQIVIVYDWHYKDKETIPAGTLCRCWHAYITL